MQGGYWEPDSYLPCVFSIFECQFSVFDVQFSMLGLGVQFAILDVLVTICKVCQELPGAGALDVHFRFSVFDSSGWLAGWLAGGAASCGPLSIHLLVSSIFDSPGWLAAMLAGWLGG